MKKNFAKLMLVMAALVTFTACSSDDGDGAYDDKNAGSNNTWDVAVTVYVNKPSQKGMVIGAGGKTLKYARKEAEPELSEMFAKSHELEKEIREKLGAIGYEV